MAQKELSLIVCQNVARVEKTI